jgi:5-methylcytosine-specific restriction endonuclease McrA
MASFPKPASRAAEKKVRNRVADLRWLAVCSLVRVRDHYRCRHCQSTFMVEAHHIKFRSAGGEDSTENVALLCRPCHRDIHGYRLAVSGNADKNLRFEVLK